MAEYSEGIMGDGAAILKDDEPMRVHEIVQALRDGDAEIERLRGSLEQIAEDDPRLGVDILRRIARAALRGESKDYD